MIPERLADYYATVKDLVRKECMSGGMVVRRIRPDPMCYLVHSSQSGILNERLRTTAISMEFLNELILELPLVPRTPDDEKRRDRGESYELSVPNAPTYI